jgi:hypothetical protein
MGYYPFCTDISNPKNHLLRAINFTNSDDKVDDYYIDYCNHFNFQRGN